VRAYTRRKGAAEGFNATANFHLLLGPTIEQQQQVVGGDAGDSFKIDQNTPLLEPSLNFASDPLDDPAVAVLTVPLPNLKTRHQL
jgi:hypothetical protein